MNELTRLVAEGRNLIGQFWPRSLLVLSAALLPCALLAQVPKIADIPDSLPAQQRQKLAQTRDSLVARKGELVKKATDHNSKCSAVPRDTPEWTSCNDEQTGLGAERHRYVDAVNRFNEEVAKAISARGSLPDTTLGAQIGTAVECRGAVFMITPGGRQFPVQNGTPIPLNAHISTAPDGHVKVFLADETVFTLGPDADMVLDEFVYDPNTTVYKTSAALIKGTFRWVTGKVTRSNPEKHLRLAVGCLGIRGTDFEAVVRPDGSGQIKLFSGELEITPHTGGLLPHAAVKNSSTFLLNAGEMVTFTADGTFSPPTPLK